MIYVRRNAGIIPQELLGDAIEAQRQLELLPPDQRPAFIRGHSAIWRAFKNYLERMSYGKCWYSESPDPQSFFDVDHFRPKARAKRSETETDNPGYEWLAFSWENFRFAANCSNRLSTNTDEGIVEGKADWFPLLEGSSKANWGDRCETQERPVLLDPVKSEDVDLVDVSDVGRVVPKFFAVGTAKRRVEVTARLYGLNLPRIVATRLRLIREIENLAQDLVDAIAAATLQQTPNIVADAIPIQGMKDRLKRKTLSSSPYALTARATLHRLGLGTLCAGPEDDPEATT
jgi:hypothetical protein